MASKGISIHVGLNHVDPNAYPPGGTLTRCIADATDMQAIASSLGYTTSLLTDHGATANAVIAAIGKAASQLDADDVLLFTYAGHGSQVDDVNGDETDGHDETLVLYDRQLIDDELFALWSRFKPGVRIVMISDSCHSGTVASLVAAFNELERAAVGRKEPDAFAKLRAELRNLFPAEALMTEPGALAPVARVRVLPADIRAVVNRLHAEENAARQLVAGPAERAVIRATVILISACQDYQVSTDASDNGLFTKKLKAVWNDGAFAGSYLEFTQAIAALMPKTQQPNYLVVGASNPAFEAQKPFTIPSAGAPTQPSAGVNGQPAHA